MRNPMTPWLVVFAVFLVWLVACEDTAPKCGGEASACATMGSACYNQRGCAEQASCKGGGDCDPYVTESPCNAATGCAWTLVCSGVALPCEDIESEPSCEAQSGCDWQL